MWLFVFYIISRPLLSCYPCININLSLFAFDKFQSLYSLLQTDCSIYWHCIWINSGFGCLRQSSYFQNHTCTQRINHTDLLLHSAEALMSASNSNSHYCTALASPLFHNGNCGLLLIFTMTQIRGTVGVKLGPVHDERAHFSIPVEHWCFELILSILKVTQAMAFSLTVGLSILQ